VYKNVSINVCFQTHNVDNKINVFNIDVVVHRHEYIRPFVVCEKAFGSHICVRNKSVFLYSFSKALNIQESESRVL
jgi:hypothetical protein